jgi:UDP-3-O-[3-hydroxymyristoyl] glucosamine N-acyltransferase
MSLTLAEIAARLGAAVEGDTSLVIVGVAGVRDGGPGEIAFVSQERYAADAAASRVSALIVGMDWNKPLPCAVLRVDKPEAAFTQVAQWFARPAPTQEPGVHSSAVVSRTAVLGRDVRVGPHAIVEADAELADRVVVGAQCYVGHGVKIGADTRLYPQVSIREFCIIGERCILHNGTVVGSDGFGYDVDPQGARHKIQQIGIVVIGNDVEIGANVTIDRARFGKTRIGNGVKIDNLVQIAHNVVIGDHAVVVAQAGVAGSTIIGSKAVLAGQAGIAGHLVVGEGAIVGAQGGVTKDIPPGAYVTGYPATPHKEAAEMHAHLKRLPQLKARVAELEKRLADLEKRLGGS